MIIDAHYEHPRLAGVYDLASGWSIDRDFYLSLADGKKLNILDLGCGTGLLCDRFASLGHSVTGLDPAAGMLEIARRKPHGTKIRWIHGAAQTFISDERFDLIIMTGHAFQVLLEEDDLKAVFRVMRRQLAANGRIVFESRNPQIDWSGRWAFERDVSLDPHSAVRIQQRILEVRERFVEFEISYQFADETLRSKSKLRFWSREEIESGLNAAGLQVVNLFGDWDRTSFRPDVSEEMIFEVVAEAGKTKAKALCIGLALIGFFMAMGEYVNKPFRFFLKAQFPQVPYWLDHVFFMLTAKLVICVILAWWLVGRKGLSLSRPTGLNAWRVAVLSGIGISALIGLVLFAVGAFQLQFQPDPLLMIGNLFSNLYEEVIYRGAILAVLRKYLKSDIFAAIGSSIVFAQGHVGYPVPLLSLVFLSGIFWCFLTQRYKSIYPAYVSHCVMDWLSDTIFKS